MSASRRQWILQTAAMTGLHAAGKTRLIFGGDVIFARGVAARIAKTGQSPLRDIAGMLRAADIAFVNLESPFSDRPAIAQAEMVFRASPEYARFLAEAGVDIVSTANNHVRDCGSDGIGFTLDLLTQHKIIAIGTGNSEEAAYGGAVIARGGMRFGFLAYTYDQANGNHRDQDPRIAMLDISRMQLGVKALRTKSDVVIVSMHAGAEYVARPYTAQIEFARAAIDAGAQLVAGHHPHVVQSMEIYKNGLILYSLGNLVFDQRQPGTERGLLAEASFQGSKLTECRLIPVDIVDTVPRVSSKDAASTILL
jgi:poly-gamma-glutamate capsule biosynthesis protein CapA/YwtB (metallophosphatase superfamily)